jgi:hypothetical protein
MPKKVAHVHKDVAEVAKAAAAELYETLMSSNELYDAWKAKYPGAGPKALLVNFVDANWARCIPLARATMARLLASPTLDPEAKERIMEALELDDTLRLGRANPKVQLN